MPAAPSVRLHSPAHATPAADSVQGVLYYKTSRAEKIDSAKITGKVLRILREWLLQGLRRLGNAELTEVHTGIHLVQPGNQYQSTNGKGRTR